MELIELKKKIVGKTVEEAIKLCNQNVIRVIIKDDEHYFGTMDYDPKRINVIVKNGLIDSINSIL